MKKICALVLIMVMTMVFASGCSVSYRDPDSFNNESSSSSVASESTESTPKSTEATTEVQVPDDYHDQIESAYEEVMSDEMYSNMKSEKLEFSGDKDNIGVTVNIVWTNDADVEILKSLALKRANAISVAMNDKAGYIQSFRIILDATAHDDAKAIFTYERNGSTLSLKKSEYKGAFADEEE